MSDSQEWIDRLTASADTRAARDALERDARYRALAGPRWNGIKAELKTLVHAYNDHSETRHVVMVEDAEHRLVLRGLDHGVDITFRETNKRIIAVYLRRSRRHRHKPAPVALRLEMPADELVVVDRHGCPVENPARFLLKPFFLSLREAERPTWWEGSGPTFPR